MKSAAKTISKGRKDTSASGGARRRIHSHIGRGLMVAVDMLVVMALIVTAYAGNVSPLKYGGAWGILGLTFPLVLLLVVVLFVVHIFWFRRCLLILGCGMLLCGGPILTFCPLNIHFGRQQAAPGDSTFTLLAYNVANLIDQRPIGTYDRSYNAMVSYILERDADIVCLSESEFLGVSDSLRITAAQYDSLQRRYPHIVISGRAQATLSKFPLRPIHTGIDRAAFGAGDIGMYRVTLPGGRLMTLFNVHLQSLGLNPADKELYVDLTELRTEDFQDVRSQLLSKVAAANVVRARQVQLMLGLIRHYGGTNVIVCGDFNDVPDCYAIRTFESAGFHSVYPQLGFGPMITFNANRFYFCIDHVLYRGDFKPLNFHKGSTKASDHYPLEVEFEVL